MIYQGIFLDDSGISHLLRIGNSGNVVDLKFSGSPFVTSMETGDGGLYAPVKCQSGTVGLVAVETDYMFGLYAGDAHELPVTLYRGEAINPARVEWMGYITPSLYDIGYSKYLEELDVDCVDGLATLEQYKYKPIGDSAGIVSLLDLVRHCVAKCECYTMMMLSTATRLGDEDPRDLWQACRISERNFMSQDTSASDGEDDMTFKEVLEEVCRWMGVTAVADGDTVFFLDYDAMVNEDANPGIIVDVATGTVTEGNMHAGQYTINGESYAETGAHLSLDEVHRKVEITCELNEFDNVLGDTFDGVVNITKDDPSFRTANVVSRVQGEYVEPGTGDNMLVGLLGADNSVNGVAFKFYKSPRYALHHYATGSGNPATTAYDNAVNYTDLNGVNGAFMARCWAQKLDDTDAASAQIGTYALPITRPSLDWLFLANGIHSLSFDEYIFMVNHNTNHITNANAANFPYFETTADLPATALFGGEDARLVISGDVLWHYRDDLMFPVPDGEVDPSNGRKTCPASDAYLLCSLQWGDMWWSGSNWGTAKTTFRVPFQLKDQRYDAVMFKSNSVLDMVRWRLGTDANGYVVTMPSRGSVIFGNKVLSSILFGLPRLTVYKPMDMGSTYNTTFMAIRNLKITPVICNPTFSDGMDDDTVYTNVIEDSCTAEVMEDTFKVCTWDGKKPNFSAVAYTDGSVMQWVDGTWHSTLSGAEQGLPRQNGAVSDGHMRQEEHAVYRRVSQYAEPSKVLEVTLHDMLHPGMMVEETNLNTRFIIDTMDKDYKAQHFKYRLIEKK